MSISFRINADLLKNKSIIVKWLHENVGPYVTGQNKHYYGINWELHKWNDVKIGDYYFIQLPDEETKMRLLLSVS